MTEVLQMPGGLARRFGAWAASLAWAGVPTASVWRLDDRSGRALFLKLVADDRRVRLSDERRRMLWAAGRIAVPRPVDYGWENQVEWLLTEGLAGQDLWTIRNTVDVDAAVRAFATGLRELHALDVDDCPFDARLNVLVPQLLDEASRTHPETKLLKPRGWTVARAAAHIEARRPGHEDLVVSHGDVCMPNILIRDGRVSGFVDVGSLGVGDRWRDLAVATWQISDVCGEQWVPVFLDAYGTAFNRELATYYTLVHELD